MSIFFTSDLHFGHKNIIEHSKRPFKSVEEMDAELIKRWNSKIGPGDSVYVLGDFSFHKPVASANIFDQLMGQKFLVRGNHDREKKVLDLFAWVKDLYTVKVPAPVDTNTAYVQRIEVCHYAMRVWNQSHRGAWMLHGHSHGSLPDVPTLLSMDVGVDTHDYYPWSFDEVAARMATKTWAPVDYHVAAR